MRFPTASVTLPVLLEGLLFCASSVDASSHAKGGAGQIHVQHPIIPVSNSQTDEPVRAKRVAIIGAGSGGSSTAHYLRRFATEKGVPVDITVFEKNPYIGGRSTTVNVYGQTSEPVELGASIFVSVNHILVNASRDFNLELQEYKVAIEEEADALGVFDGKSFVFNIPSEATWWSNFKIIWKYGLVPIRTIQLMKSTVERFLQMYTTPVFPFKDLTEAATTLELVNATRLTGQQFLEAHNVGGKFSTDMVQASTRVNYAQNLGLIHGLETMVSMAADGAMAIKGGNWKMFEAMCIASGAVVKLNTTVTSVQKTEEGAWKVFSKKTKYDTGIEGNEENTRVMSKEEKFDTVVLASPYQFSDLDISPPLRKVPDEIPYVQLYVTLFTSPKGLDPAYFNLPAGSLVPSTILTTLNETEQNDEKILRGVGPDGVGSVGFYSLSSLRQVKRYAEGSDGEGPFVVENLYKVFSASEFTDEKVRELLGVKEDSPEKDQAITWSYRKTWNSYPVLYPRVTFENIVLDGHNETLFYTSGIESFISTMETSGLMGMNVAKLVVDSWEGKKEQ